MTPQPMMDALAAARLGPSGMVRIPSSAEQEEVKRVQGMQVRTNAANLASMLLQGKDFTPPGWTELAKVIELYIWGEAPTALSP